MVAPVDFFLKFFVSERISPPPNVSQWKNAVSRVKKKFERLKN